MTSDSETPDFEALLRPGFRWPTRGDQAFTTSERWQDNSYIDRYGHGRLVVMMTGYKMAADLIVSHVAHARNDGDFLVFPVIFNYRQFVELSLKYLIATYGYTVGIDAQWNTHDLGVLWSTFVRVLDGYGCNDAEDTDTVVGNIIAEFAKVDPRSFSYRYPVDTKGKLVDLAHEEVDLHQLADVMKGLEGYFSGCDGYLDSLQSAGP